MKNIIKILFLGMMLFATASSIAQHSNMFVESECGLINNPDYYMENYRSGYHAYGCRVYHNGVIIFDEAAGMLGAITGHEMKFVNDTCGFMIISNSWMTHSVYMITGDDVEFCAGGPTEYYDFFVVNANAAYLINYLPGYQLLINKAARGQTSGTMLKDTSYTVPITITDTIRGMPLCNGLTQLHVGNTTGHGSGFDYTINLFVTDSTLALPENPQVSWKVYPNPASDFIRIKSSRPGEAVAVTLLNRFGSHVRDWNHTVSSGAEMYIGDLAEGIYFLEIRQGEALSRHKVVKTVPR